MTFEDLSFALVTWLLLFLADELNTVSVENCVLAVAFVSFLFFSVKDGKVYD